MPAQQGERAGTSRRRRSRRLFFEPLEDRTVLGGNPPFAVGGDPSVNPADFRVTTFASGLNYPHGMTTLSDGSLLVAVNNPVSGESFYSSSGELLRFVDANGDGVADGSGQALFNNLPGEVTALHQAGDFILATSSETGSERISFLRTGATPSDSLTMAGSINFSFPAGWEHTSYASVVRPTPGQPGYFDVIFNVGSEYNGVLIGSNGNVVLDGNGNPTYVPSNGTATAGGLISGTLLPDSLYMVTIHDNNGTPVVANLKRIAAGLRNAASLAIDPSSGDLYIADNGIDGNGNGADAWSSDELDRIPAAQFGTSVPYFGFPEQENGQLTESYYKAIAKPGDSVTVVNPSVGTQPLIAFEPLPDSSLPADGSRSQGSSGFALSPPDFPAGLNQGAFIGFHGDFIKTGGTANDKNPVIFADPSTGHYFDFVSNDLANIGHIDEMLSTSDSLFLADISSGGGMAGGSMTAGPGQGIIYQIQVINSSNVNHPPVLAPIANQTVYEGTKLTVQASATDPDANQTITYSLAAGAPSGATIGPQSGLFTWTPDAYAGSGTYSITVVATDNGSPPLSDSTSFTVNVLPVNHSPNFLSIPAQIVERTQPLQVKIGDYVSDPDVPAQTLSYSLAPGAPAGASVNGTGVFTWTPSDTTQITVYSIGVTVTDSGSPPLSALQTFTINVVPFNHPPVLAAIPTQTVNEGSQLTVEVTATDPDLPVQTLSYVLGPGAPAGAAIGVLSGVFTWVPDPYSGSGTYPVTIIVTDNGAIPKSDSTTFTINVLPLKHPPEFAPISDVTPQPSQTLQLGVARFVSDPDRPAQTLSYALTAGAPFGTSIDPVTGLFTWKLPSSEHIGSYQIGVMVTDSGSPPLSVSTSFTVNVFDLGPPALISRASVLTKPRYAISLKFSQPLDAQTAENPSNYILVPVKRKNAKNPPVMMPIPLSVSYNPKTNVVRLTALEKVKLKQALELTVIGTAPNGVAKISGVLLAGVRKRTGTNFVAFLTGKTITHK